MDPPEPPECPVCLQPYDGSTTTPRVLSCGHSACQTCLPLLPQPFSHTIRCPSCTQLVKFTNPTSLPKNIDLLRLSASLLQYPHPQNPPNPQNPIKSKPSYVNFVPNFCPYEFYVKWKEWVIAEGEVVLGFSFGEDLCSDSCVSPIRCLMKGGEEVSLVRVGGGCFETDSKFKYSYMARILRVLYEMRDGERDELGMILRTLCLKRCRIGKVYGLWYNLDDQGVYIVCERYGGSFQERFGNWRSGFVGEKGSDGLLYIKSFAMVGMETCEALSSLHAEGLFSGCLAMTCFSFDDFGHVHIDLNEAVVMSRRIRRLIGEAILGVRKGEELELSLRTDVLDSLAFVSPELLFELQQKNATDLACGSKFEVGYASDVWSLACVLLWLLLGEPFTELMWNYLQCFVPMPIDGKDCDSVLYTSWIDKVKASLETKLVSEFVPLQEMLCGCLSTDPGSRPSVIDLWKCIRELIIEPKMDVMVGRVQVINKNKGHCLFLGELCQFQKGSDTMSERQIVNGLQEKNNDSRANFDQVGEVRVERDLVEGLCGGHVKCIDLKGHLDCITGLTVGGGFLFSSSFDKTVRLWSLQDFTHVHTFVGHEHKVMAVVFVDDELPLCISGDNGGGIYIWGICNPFGQEPIKKLFEEKDWRYSGIHALAISGTGYLYTGSGDKSIKAWSLQDYTLSSIMNGHKSVVSTLAVCNGVLYSGSWDGTVRLWSLSDHSPLTVLGEDTPGKSASVLSLAADGNALVAAHENGCVKEPGSHLSPPRTPVCEQSCKMTWKYDSLDEFIIQLWPSRAFTTDEIWRNDVLIKTKQSHKGAIFAVGMEGKWLFTGGWDKVVNVQELIGDDSDEFQLDTMDLGSISCNSVTTALLYWQGKLFVGQADRITKVYCYGV